MPLKVPDNLPAKKVLESEKIVVMNESRAFKQDIRPLRIVIFNLMPTKEATELDILRVLSNSPLQIEVTFAHTESRLSRHIPLQHLENFYKTISEIHKNKYDGVLVTGAPVETLPFEEITYWRELTDIFEWTKTNATSAFHICWGAQAALYYHYGIPKRPLEKKLFGVYPHYNTHAIEKFYLTRGFDDEYYVPHSRHTEIREEDVLKISELKIISKSAAAGVNIVSNSTGKQIFITGHFEYNAQTLYNEYIRDINKNIDINIPENYFRDNDPAKEIVVRWRGNGNLLYNNWLNFVYQETPYDIDSIGTV